MTGIKPPEDPSEAPTGLYDFGTEGQGDPERGSAPWYRRPIISLSAALFAAILLGLAIYFLADQTRGSGGTKQTPTSPTTPTSAPPTSKPTTTTEPAAPAETTTMTFAPSTSEPTTTAPTNPPTTTTTVDGHHHHHHHDGGTP